MKKTTSFLAIIASWGLVALPVIVFAQINDPLQGRSIAEILVGLTNWLLGLVTILAVVGIVYGGIRMIIAVGNEQGVASAKKIVFWSIAGLVVAILALTIVNVIARNILGVAFGGTPAAYAQSNIGADIDALKDATGLRISDPKTIAQSAVGFVLSIIGVVLLAVIIYGGFQYITSLGDEQKTAHAKKIILSGIVGLIIIGVSVIIVNIVVSLFN